MPTRDTTDESDLFTGRQVTGDEFWTLKIKEDDELKTRYCEYQNTVPINDRVVFYESMSGARMMDSPYALFQELYNDPEYADFHHVWSVRNRNVVPAKYEGDERVSFVTRNTDAHIFFLNRAKFVVGNSVQPEFMIRRPEQKFLNTWHGIAYKTLGRDFNTPLGAASSVYSLLQTTHALTPCEFMTRVQLERFSMRGIYTGDLAEVGYPRLDLTINLDESVTQQLSSELGLDPTKKTVLYAPTWRGVKGSATFDASHLEDDLKAMSRLDANVVFLAHHIMLRHIKNVDLGRIIVPPSNVNTNELLGIVDLLVTDYSSIFFDYLITDRPIIHYLYDYEVYESERGLLLDLDELPGPVVTDTDTLKSTASSLLEGDYFPTDEYLSAKARFCPHDDGRASERTKQWFFGDDEAEVNHVDARTKPSVIYWGGRLDESVKTQHFLDHLKKDAESGKKDVTLFVAYSVASNTNAMETIRGLGSSISVVARKNYEMGMTIAEKTARTSTDTAARSAEPPAPRSLLRRVFDRPRGTKNTLLNSKHNAVGVDPMDDRQLMHAMYGREYRRIFGDATFDEVVEFESLSSFWRQLAKHASVKRS